MTWTTFSRKLRCCRPSTARSSRGTTAVSSWAGMYELPSFTHNWDGLYDAKWRLPGLLASCTSPFLDCCALDFMYNIGLRLSLSSYACRCFGLATGRRSHLTQWASCSRGPVWPGVALDMIHMPCGCGANHGASALFIRRAGAPPGFHPPALFASQALGLSSCRRLIEQYPAALPTAPCGSPWSTWREARSRSSSRRARPTSTSTPRSGF